MNWPFEVFHPQGGPYGGLPPERPRHTAHPYQGARTKRAIASQRWFNTNKDALTHSVLPYTSVAPEDILSKHLLELQRMFPPRRPEPLGPSITPVIVYEESIEDQHSIIQYIKTTHERRVAERRLHPKRKGVRKKKCGGRPVPQRVASVNAMDVDHDDVEIHSLSFSPLAAQLLSGWSPSPVVASRPHTPTTPRPVPDFDEDSDGDGGDGTLIAAEFDRQYRVTLEKAQRMQI